MRLDDPLARLRQADGTIRKIAAIGPSSARIIAEVLETGGSATVEAAIAASGRAIDVARRRGLRTNLLSRARVLEVLRDETLDGPSLEDYRGDFQMHSEWSDGDLPLPALAAACAARGYQHSAVTDHSFGLPLAGGLSTTDLRRQHREIDQLNDAMAGRFRLLKGVEANIQADGSLDLSVEDLRGLELDLVLAAPHAKLRESTDQTARMVRAATTPGVHILAHPRGRKLGERTGVLADWKTVFEAAAEARTAIEIDGDPSRQDLDAVAAQSALEAGCLFALDSDAHTERELVNAETAIAHARLAGIPPERIVNCWPLDQLMDWAIERGGRR